MVISVGSDHAGYDLKMKIIEYLESKGYDVLNRGAESSDEPYSYVEAGQAIAHDIILGTADKAVAICGTGIGISIVVNKHKGIRCGLCTNEYMARMSRQHNDANVLAIGARVVGQSLALSMVDSFFDEEFAGERHAQRVDDIRLQEESLFK